MKINQYEETTEYILETKKEIFLRYFKERNKDENKVMFVTIRHKDLVSDELIINLESNIDKKIAYYENAYNDNLELKSNNSIKISAYSYNNLNTFPILEIVK